MFLREHRHELLDTDFQPIRAHSSRLEPGGHETVNAGLLVLATLAEVFVRADKTGEHCYEMEQQALTIAHRQEA